MIIITDKMLNNSEKNENYRNFPFHVWFRSDYFFDTLTTWSKIHSLI